MADSPDKVLEILIKLGYVGGDQAEAARKAIAGIKQETGDLSQTLPEGSEIWSKYKNVLGEAKKGAEGFTESGHGMRHIATELNHVIPGLGMAFRGLVTAMGPVAVVVLALQAAITWWKFYRDQVEEAAEAQAKALDKMRAATRGAVEENTRFAKSFEDVRTASQITDEALKDAQAVLEARLKALGKITGQDVSAGERQARIDLLGNVIASAESKIGQLTADYRGVYGQIVAAKTPEERETLTKKLKADDDEIQGLREQVRRMENERRTSQNVLAYEQAGRAQKDIFDVMRGAQARGSVTPEEADLITRVGSIAAGHQLNLSQAFQLLEVTEKSNFAQNQLLERLILLNKDQLARIIALEHHK